MKVAICLSKLASMAEWSHSYCDVRNSALGFSLFHLEERVISLFFVGFMVVVEEIYTSVACDIGDIFRTYNVCFLQLADCWFSCTMIRKLFSHFL